MPVIEIYDLPARIVDRLRESVERSDDSEIPPQMCMLMRKPPTEEGSGQGFAAYLPLDLSAGDAEEIRWYLECYVQEPLAQARAKKALEKLYDHGRGIIKSINWNSLIPPEMRDEIVILRVQSEDETRGTHVFWELLERTELWPSPAPPKVLVLRTPHSDLNALVSFYKEEIQTFNILLVSARPDAEDDIPHRLVSQILLESVRNMPASSKFSADLEIVRPGTFESLKEHLGRYPKGHFRVVHFDVHGVQDSSGQ